MAINFDKIERNCVFPWNVRVDLKTIQGVTLLGFEAVWTGSLQLPLIGCTSVSNLDFVSSATSQEVQHQTSPENPAANTPQRMRIRGKGCAVVRAQQARRLGYMCFKFTSLARRRLCIRRRSRHFRLITRDHPEMCCDLSCNKILLEFVTAPYLAKRCPNL